MAPSTPIRSVSGVRGVVGESLDGDAVARYAYAFGRGLEGGTVAVGRDARPSGVALFGDAARGLAAAGARVVDLGLCATPAVQVAVEELGAAGGLVLTASHNPRPWNGLKFVGGDGTFLGREAVERLFAEADRAAAPAAAEVAIETESRAVAWQVRRALGSPGLDLANLREAGLSVVVDGCRSVGGPSTVAALTEAGVTVFEIDTELDGAFTRVPEPLPQHLGALGRAVRERRADFGVAHDPDGDRAALVDERGEPLGEEYTLALAVAAVLEKQRGPVVVNLSTSRMSEDWAERLGVPFHRTPVGEANVVGGMRARGAVVGGEGNGGVIVPAAHPGRDGTVAALLAADWRAARAEPLSRARETFDRYTMMKEKLEGAEWAGAPDRLRAAFAGAERIDDRDGLRFAWPRSWVHVRPSGTEPVVRVIAEAPGEDEARELCRRARLALAP